MTESIYYDAAKEIYGAAVGKLTDTRGVHAESAVAALSAVCGECLLRSCNMDLSEYPPGGIVIANKLVTDTAPRLLGYLEQVLNEFKIAADDWAGKVPRDHQTYRDPLKLAAELRPQICEIQKKNGFDDSQSAHAACMALALVIRDSKDTLKPDISILIASNVMLRAAKSVPLN